MAEAKLKTGGKAKVVGKHPHAGCTATLLSYGPYGLSFLNLVGWRCRRDDSPTEEFYAKAENLKGI